MGIITDKGDLVTLGNSMHGQLGLGQGDIKSRQGKNNYRPSSIQSKNAQMDKVDIKDVKQVSCGFRHTACVTDDGKLYTWGEGKQGQLGHGDL